ncbi:MAG: hypothetical protein EXR69_14950 [Myxococcales bacterium]|nr:hypothetical protein [Myxococcales bacterium]
MPSLRQFALLAGLWAAVAWVTSAVWGVHDLHQSWREAFFHYYAVRAPFVGALSGVLWAPVLCAGMVPGRASALAGRPVGLAVERRTRLWVRALQGSITGILVGPTGTVLSLLIWPNDSQNSRWEAFKWGGFIWYSDWKIFVPAGTIAGILSVWVALRLRRHR